MKASALFHTATPGLELACQARFVIHNEAFRSGITLIAVRPPDCHAVYPKPGSTEYLYQSFKDGANATTVIISCGPSGWR